MKKYFFLIALILPAILFAQDYKASSIPDSLKKDADAVLRNEELYVDIKNNGKAVFKRKWAYTILNESGSDYGVYMAEYDKFRSLSDISGKLFDADGKELKSIRKKEILDVPVSDGESLVTDGRTKEFAFPYTTYPYTVEFEDEMTFDGIFWLPDWIPIDHQRVSVQRSVFTVETTVNYQLRYKQANYEGMPAINDGGRGIIYSWQVVNRPAVIKEPNQPDWLTITPNVLIAPTDFEIGGYKGNMASWEGLGNFINQLYSGRDELPANVKSEVHRLTDGVGSKNDKIAILYNYLQQTTHYVSIQLGMGGWQPFEAKFVAEKKYGDCKALSNYMVSLLKEAGITANCVIILAGEGKKGLYEDFPMNNFNHVIVCVPDAKDSVWLECTSQTLSAGYLGMESGNRKALLIAASGGAVVSTPNYTSSDNVQLRKVNAKVDEKGNLVAEVTTRFTGAEQELQHSLINGEAKEREKYLNNALNLPTYSVEKNVYHETKGRIPVIDEYLKINSPGYASVSARRLFIVPNLFEKVRKMSVDKPRKFDFQFNYAYRDVDTIFIQVPDGYISESIPKNTEIKNKFGYYKITYEFNDNTIKLLRISERNIARFPSSEYKNIVDFYDQMYKADIAKLVLIKKE